MTPPHTSPASRPAGHGQNVEGRLLHPDALDPADADTLTVEILGPDTQALTTFAACMILLVTAGLIGHHYAGPAGTITGAGLAASGLFVGAHVWAWRRTRSIDAYATKAPPHNASNPGSRGPVTPVEVADRSRTPGLHWQWTCTDCRTYCGPTHTRGEARHLAGIHDRLHHGTRPTATIHPTGESNGAGEPPGTVDGVVSPGRAVNSGWHR